MKIVKASRGTIEQFSTALKNKIAEIQQTDNDDLQVTSSTTTEDIMYRDKYLHDLISILRSRIAENYVDPSNVVFNYDDENLYIHNKDGDIDEFIPLSHLHFDFEPDRMETDVEFILDYVFGIVEGCQEVMADTIPEDDPDRIRYLHEIRYLHDLIGWVQYQMEREDLPANQTIFDTTDDALIITMGGDNVVEFEVPFTDLSFDFDKIWDDVEYIIGAMI